MVTSTLNYTKMKIILYISILFLSVTAFGQQIPASKQTETINIVGATAHIGNGKVIKNSVISFENGKLTLVIDANLIRNKLNGKIIQAKGKHVYPGFITMNSTLGLIEIDAVKATEDAVEIGEFNPHIRSIIAYNPESRITETVKANGVLIGQITPRGNRISGTSSVVQFDAWNYEDATLKIDDGIHLNWPEIFYRSGWWVNGTSIKENKNYEKQKKNMYDFFDKNSTKIYSEINLKYEALKGIFDGSKTLYIHVNNEKEIIEAISFKKHFKIKKVVLIGAHEAYKITKLLKENAIAVVLQRVHSLPNTEDEDIKLPYKLAKILDDAGILVALDIKGDMERMNSRNLPFYAGTTVAYGLDYEKAVAMITANPAKILGMENQTGTLETGKDATLIISTGDALDMRTNNIEKAFIQGRDINLDTHQKQLYRKYTNKYKK